jgi:hypothetical protein
MQAEVDSRVYEAAMKEFEDDPSVVYVLDEDLRLAYCNEAWDEFAEHNGGPHLRRVKQIGHPVLDAISEPLKAFYRSAFERSLAERQPWEHWYECSSPECYRGFHMQVMPLQAPARLVVRNSLVVEKAHQRIRRAPLTAVYRTAGGIIEMCMHCRKTRRSEGSDIWDWVPEFLATPPDNVSHGLCESCFHHYYPQEASGSSSGISSARNRSTRAR